MIISLVACNTSTKAEELARSAKFFRNGKSGRDFRNTN